MAIFVQFGNFRCTALSIKKTYSDQQLTRVTTVVPLIQIQRDSLEMYIRFMALVV